MIEKVISENGCNGCVYDGEHDCLAPESASCADERNNYIFVGELKPDRITELETELATLKHELNKRAFDEALADTVKGENKRLKKRRAPIDCTAGEFGIHAESS